ncbi:MAG TPA: histidine kinase [Alphaproteobacteria bacterium]|nr:histidine kinase [Alphaproteobacteria bacterium]
MTDATTELSAIALPRRELRRRIVIAVSLVLMVLAAVASLFLVQGVDSQIRDVQHTYEVRRQAGQLIQYLVDAETGQRGYLLTQDPSYLEPYRAAIASLDATYQNLLALVADNPAQRARIQSLAESIEQKRSEMAATIARAAEGQLSEALSITRSDAGRSLMDGIREVLGAFVAEEDSKLIERNAQVDSSRLWLVTMIIAALAGAAVLTYMLLTRTLQQISTLTEMSTELQSLNLALETRVRERTAELEEARAHAERERARVETLLQDTNHRIGNSLATVSSLLGLQVARTTSPEVRSALEAAQNRVHAIASGHRRLRLGTDLETVNAAEFLQSVVEDLQATQATGRDVRFETDLEPLVIFARDATTIGIIVGELVINALKHAFPDGRSGQIWTRFGLSDGTPVLVVEDDGRGLPPDAGAAETGLGAMIIRQLAAQFGGEPRYETGEGGGTRVVLPLPKLEIDRGRSTG